MLRSNIISIFFASVFFVLLVKSVFAAEFLCTKYSNVNFRNGPGVKFAIVYKIFKKGYPVKVIDTIDGIDGYDGYDVYFSFRCFILPFIYAFTSPLLLIYSLSLTSLSLLIFSDIDF
jgi:hypothetical protein